MNVSLQAVTKRNYQAVCKLKVKKSQRHFLSPNIQTIVESKFDKSTTTRAIYLDKKVVGLLLWEQETRKKISIWRFMIDKKYQKKGIGRIALELAIDELKQCKQTKRIQIGYSPANVVARDLYAQLGFVETGMCEDNEDMLAIMHVAKR